MSCKHFLFVYLFIGTIIVQGSVYGQSLFDCSSAGDVSSQECEVLIDMYEELQGEQWTSSEGRLLGTTIGNREGVSVGVREGEDHIISIDLAGLGLIGQPPSSLSDLEYLEVLTIADNGITSLPQTIGLLEELVFLDISNTSLSQLPESIGTLSSLSTLDIGGTLIQYLPNMAGLTELDQFNCTHSKLLTLDANLMQLPELNSIDCRWSDVQQVNGSFSTIQSLQLSSTNIESLGPISLPNISFLKIDETPLLSIQIIGSMPLLDRLDLGETLLTSIDSLLEKIPAVQYLWIDNALLTSLGDISSLQILKELRFNDNKLESLPVGVEQLVLLELIYGRNNSMQGVLPTGLVLLEELESVYLDGNAFDRLQDHTIQKNAQLIQRSQSLGYKYSDDGQIDNTSPILTLQQAPAFFQTGSSLEVQIVVDENSYLIDDEGQSLAMSWSGSQSCVDLGTTPITQNGLVELSYSVGTGVYQDCSVVLEDHAFNQTILPVGSRVVGETIQELCLHPDLTVSVQECEALIAVYEETGGENWYAKQGWFESTDIDTWHGVDVEDGHVVGVYLHTTTPQDGHGEISTWNGNNLTGEFPESLSQLPYLQNLNLSNNWLRGQIPELFQGLTELELLIIRNNRLTGQLPDSLGSFGSLKILDLSDNRFSGTIPSSLNNLGTLEVLDLSDNTLKSGFDNRISGLQALRVFDLSNNTLEGELPGELSLLVNLQLLRLEENLLIGSIPASRTSLALTSLTLHNNAFARTLARSPIMDVLMTQWRSSIATRTSSNQDDISAPSIEYVGDEIFWSQPGAFDITIAVNEESYVLDVYDQGMEVVFSGSVLCEQLSTDRVTIGSGLATITIIPGEDGWYEGCELMIQDHGDNVSNAIVWGDFTTYSGPEAICYHPQLTTSRDSCEALIIFYTQTNGESWTTSTGWGEDPIVQSWLGVSGDKNDGTITEIDLSGNNLSGSLVLNIANLIDLERLDLSDNILTELTLQIESYHGLKMLDVHSNTISSSLLTDLEGFTDLEYLDGSNNPIEDTFPGAIELLPKLKTINLGSTQISGALNEYAGSDLLEYFDVSETGISGKLTSGILSGENLISVDISNSKIDRTQTYDAILPEGGTGFIQGLPFYDSSGQDDTTAPKILGVTHPGLIESLLPVTLDIYEGSFAVTSSGAGMETSITGPGYCTSITSNQNITWSSGTGIIALSILFEGAYQGCEINLTDHGGNTSSIGLQQFNSSLRCGNGTIDAGEVCDEGRSCEDGRDCTQDPGICPSECEVRMVDNCTASCTISACGDSVVDSAGLDNVLGTFDDEQCDPGSYCLSTGQECGTNPEICPGGTDACKLRQTSSCTPACSFGGCGDGYVDLDGTDNILETDDDEACDMGDVINGDGCSSSCQLEFCGDGLVDLDGLDNNFSTLDDNEECDQGPYNGTQGGICTSQCTIPDQECLYCFEVCDGGDSEHTLFLILDSSGSMGDNNKLQKAKDGAIEFVNLVDDRTQNNTGFATAIGLIEYWSDARVVVSPTTDFTQLRNAINGLQAGGSTNIGKALDVAYEYFDENQNGKQQHVVILSDGEPTVGGNGLNPVDWAYDRAEALESIGAGIYTIALELSLEGIEIMRNISSSQIQNIALGKTTSQSSTNYRWNDYKSSWKAVDNSLNNSYSIAQTNDISESYWEVDLGDIFIIDIMKLWNRTGPHARKTSDYHIMVRDTPFTSTDLTTTLNDPQTWSIHTVEQAGRPTLYDLDEKLEGRYIRIQQRGSSHFTINEFEVLGCELGEPCYEVFSYEDYQGDAIELIYSHIFGSIHCGCSPEQVCSDCGDGEVYEVYGESCDLGSECNDGRDCSNDDQICPGECTIRADATCTNQCRSPVCGDGIVTSPNSNSILEECDNGMQCSNSSPCSLDSQCIGIGDELCSIRSGDGCNELCQIESCGDRIVDYDGADNVWQTSDDEYCDDGDQNGGDNRCQNDCTRNPSHAGDPGLCGITEPLYTSSGDGSGLTSLFSGLCDAGVSVDFKYYPGLHSRGWRCLGEQGAQDTLCELKERWCGDGMIDFNAGEMCDDGNQTDGDGCDSTCSLESVVQPYLENTGLCHQNIQPLVVQSNEIIPLTWSLDVVSGVDKNATGCDDLGVGTFIPGGTLLCEIEINQLETITVPCLGFNNGSRELFEDVIEDYDRSLSKTIGGSILDVGMLGVGRQALQLKNISYTYCDTTREGAKRYHTYQEDEGVCMMPLTIINPYRIEKGSTLSTTQEAQMQQITNESGEVLIDTQAIESVTASNSTIDVKKILALFMEQFVDDHRWGSIIPAFPFGADQSTKKSLTDRLHFFMGSQTRGSIRIDDHFLANPEKPFSLVVENADLILEGSLEGNGMYIVDGGDIIFESQNCDMTNTIEGVFITDGTFKTSSTLNTDPYASQRCKGGNLVINGLFIGEGLNTEFVSRRRAQVDLRSFEDLNQSDSEEQLVQNRLNQSKRLIEGPSVRIDTSPLSWSELPPGVRELFEVIAVRK